MRLPEPPLLVITDRRVARYPLEEVAARAFEGGCRWLSLRDKDLPADRRSALLGRLLSLAEKFDATLTCHGDRPDQAGPHGLHLSRGGSIVAARRVLGSEVLIGRSAHDEAEAGSAAAAGADYVAFGPVFPSVSKAGYGSERGFERLRAVTAGLDLPVISLGGITAGNAGSCIAAGAAGIAVVGSVMAAKQPEEAVAGLLRALDDAARFRSV